jgi:hypothetical protein
MKVPKENLLNEISDDLNQFLKYGDLSPFTREIDPNLNIDNLNKLLRIHFVLTKGNHVDRSGVIDFVERLPQRLRRIKTTTQKETELFEGKVRGRIAWSDTISERYKKNPKEKKSFICEKKEKKYNIAENLVLKRLLQIIHTIIHSDLKVAFKEQYKWLNEWIDGKELKNTLTRLFLRNVYLKRIDIAKITVTDRMINRAMKSRNVLYREAAELLGRYNKLMAHEIDPSEAKELLRNTFIKPDKADVLFELYWTIKIIKLFRTPEDPKFNLIEPESKNIIAIWEKDGHEYKIYHDSTGSFEFKEKADEIILKLEDKDNFLGRELKVLKTMEQLTGLKTDSLWGGRPDILLEKYDNKKELISIFIGEVKYTQSKDYAIQGLKQLLEYMALIKQKRKYFEPYESLFKGVGKIKGCLFLDYIDKFKLVSCHTCNVV